MDDLAELIIKKLREDDGPREGVVALASWWDTDSRLNLMVQPVTKNGMVSYNVLRAVWRSATHVGYGGWVRMTDAKIASFPALKAACNFETLEGVARFLVATGKTGECSSSCKAGVQTISIGRRSNRLFCALGARCETTDDALLWLRLMDEMRAPIE
jgi:hypothetical protein